MTPVPSICPNDPSRQTEPLKAYCRFLPCLSTPDAAIPADVLFPLYGVAFLCGLDTPSLQVQGGQRRSPYFNTLRDISFQDVEAIPSYCRLALTQ